MKMDDVQNLQHGICIIHWNDGGKSEGVIGSQQDGTRWFAVSNWVSKNDVPGGYTEDHWSKVYSVVFLSGSASNSLASQVEDLIKDVDFEQDKLCNKSIDYRAHNFNHEANATDLIISGIDITRRKLRKLDY